DYQVCWTVRQYPHQRNREWEMAFIPSRTVRCQSYHGSDRSRLDALGAGWTGRDCWIREEEEPYHNRILAGFASILGFVSSSGTLLSTSLLCYDAANSLASRRCSNWRAI